MSDFDPKQLADQAGNTFFNEQDPFDTLMLVYDQVMKNNGSLNVDVDRAATIMNCFNQMKLVSEADPSTFTIRYYLIPRLAVK